MKVSQLWPGLTSLFRVRPPLICTQNQELLLSKCLAAIARKTHVTVRLGLLSIAHNVEFCLAILSTSPAA